MENIYEKIKKLIPFGIFPPNIRDYLLKIKFGIPPSIDTQSVLNAALEKKELKEKNKKECPKCHSTNLELAGVEMDMESAKEAGDSYKCLVCGQFFLYHKAA